MWETLESWDHSILIYINNLGAEPYDMFWLFITRIDSWIALFILMVFLLVYYFRKRSGRHLLLLLLAFGVTMTASVMTKSFIQRLRPNNNPELSDSLRILQQPLDYSFFSGHASSSFVVTTFLFLVLRKQTRWIYLLFLWPLLFTYSRLYVGVHYPTDLLVGASVGIALAVIIYSLGKRWMFPSL